MKVLVAHNFYQQPGGEDQVFRDEVAMLRDRGNEVVEYTVHNDALAGLGKIELARKTIWNQQTYEQLSEVVRREKPAIAHFHNTFPLMSPSAYYAAREGGARVVQTLHNFRLMCPSATLYRDGHVCEDCVGRRFAWPAIAHACYRGSRSASAVTAVMLRQHRARGTWHDAVDVYIALTQFARDKMIQGGLPREKIVVKPNFVSPDPGEGTGGGRFVLFVGRLTEEKGIDTLLRAWESATPQGLMLRIAGDGPLRGRVEQASHRLRSIEYLGRRPSAEVYAILAHAEALLFPSVWYEGLPRTIIEAFSKGTPVVASKLGSMAELVTDGRNGLLVEPGHVAAWARALGELSCRTDRLSELRRGAREEFLRCYTADRNYPMLMAAYEQALAN
ncbi:MAG: glycosyltransferase [Tepidisphaeraceae bacterium]